MGCYIISFFRNMVANIYIHIEGCGQTKPSIRLLRFCSSLAQAWVVVHLIFSNGLCSDLAPWWAKFSKLFELVWFPTWAELKQAFDKLRLNCSWTAQSITYIHACMHDKCLTSLDQAAHEQRSPPACMHACVCRTDGNTAEADSLENLV